MVAGGINAFEQAERLLRNKSGDIVAAARQSLADRLVQKMRRAEAQISVAASIQTTAKLDNRHMEVTCQPGTEPSWMHLR